MKKQITATAEALHATAGQITRACLAHEKAQAAISPDLRPEVAKARLGEARQALDVAVKEPLSAIREARPQAEALRQRLGDVEACLLLAGMAGPEQAAVNASDSLLIAALASLTTDSLLDLAGRGKPLVVLLARQELARRVADKHAPVELVAAFDATALERFGRPDLIRQIADAEREALAAERRLLEAHGPAGDVAVRKLALAHAEAALPAA
ncbi:SMC family protein [Desulfarculus baarsii DSM 2075]|uniref:SMC family protein n=1 Tax=Desulfarculus baarsii (strain ATCC 33931 / DSM 2075 / LMG 7858 / VKM B-1802 / 2st14) TaxID=644282 RepID=E1QDH5_DESB2|nr:hypothetical protein [Desulfarculus baarsii]ADK83494.1 SMC family protein [Desulfarculus baarsii DSM 2075]